MKEIKLISFLFLIYSILFFNFNCSKKKTELDLIKETLEKIVDNVENKNTDTIMLYISESYSDDQKRKKNDIKSIIDSYLNRYKGIIVNILEVRAVYIKAASALIETEIALSSGIARALRKVTNISSRYYKFTVELVKEGQIWIVKSTKWEYISENDLSIESKDILKIIIE